MIVIIYMYHIYRQNGSFSVILLFHYKSPNAWRGVCRKNSRGGSELKVEWNQGRIQRFLLGGRDHGERVEREPITGAWGRSHQRGQEAEPLVRGQGAKPPWSWKLFGSSTSHKPQNLPSFLLLFFLQSVHYIYTMSGEKESMVYYA